MDLFAVRVLDLPFDPDLCPQDLDDPLTQALLAAREAGLRIVGATADIGPVGTPKESAGANPHRHRERFPQAAR